MQLKVHFHSLLGLCCCDLCMSYVMCVISPGFGLAGLLGLP